MKGEKGSLIPCYPPNISFSFFFLRVIVNIAYHGRIRGHFTRLRRLRQYVHLPFPRRVHGLALTCAVTDMVLEDVTEL